MTDLLRSLVVWLMLLALPYQGYAAAAMMACAPAPPAASHIVMPTMHAMHAMHDLQSLHGSAGLSRGTHDHAAMLAATAQDHPDGSSAHAGHAHGSVKCGGAACCLAGAPLLSDLAVMPVLPAIGAPIAFYAEFLPAVDLAHPERPPQAHFA
ncbi:MAG: hypothetical protein ABW069_01285 [Duganella sp.]